MGCMGMRVDDFLALTPQQFDTVYGTWKDRQDMLMESEWQQTRMMIWGILKPYSKSLVPSDIFPLPSDKTKPKGKKRTLYERKQDQVIFENYCKLWK